ncbi:MAG: P27 family phage terminase small subunit [Actinomycetota bacterium]|nr:P27 family phage terminase small subunit [Actinomycetota bacterium]
MADYELERQHLRILQAALEAWDRMTEARETIAAEGATFHDRFGTPRKHPAIGIEENARTAFLRAMRELDLDGEPLPDPRPNRR